MKRLIALILLAPLSCTRHDILLVEYTPPKPVVKQDDPTMVLLYNDSLGVYREQALNESKKRFNHPIVILGDSAYDRDGNWITKFNTPPDGWVEDFALVASATFPTRDIVFFSNNPKKTKIGTHTGFWYFQGPVFENGTLKVNIWDAICTPTRGGNDTPQ